ncbi:hypothetical protein DPMN_131520 [Dreissena polymorpha]|uniref:Uncharacterized protein n=1 Tax=Dreissena polymorpha TaxID=45954 RepID=A0A9D4HAJ9_DREPO|nr:hypothetical protein DPMN_073204 [Dreissena polymorpha]KAH3829524.1 hypothetical protein DPMN_131520 [Dreissena polymorpha]
MHYKEVSSLSLGCTCQASARRGVGPSSPCRRIETKAEEELDRGAQPTPTLQHCHTERRKQEDFKVILSKSQVLEELLEEETIEQK